MHPVKRIVLQAVDSLGVSRVSKEYRGFMQMHGFFTFAVNLSGMFVSTFLLKAGSGVALVGWFYLLSYLFECSLYFVTARLTGFLRPTTLSRFGLLLYMSSYITLLTFREGAVQVFPLISLLSAIGASLYWLPFHVYTVAYSTMANRQVSISLMGITANMIMLLTPPVSGSVIYFLPGFSGYLVVFVLSSVSFLFAALTTRKLPSEPSSQKDNVLVTLIKREYRNKLVHSLAFAHFFFGLRDGLFLYYLNLLIFMTTSNELILGLNTTGRGLLVMLMYTLINRFDSNIMRKRLPLLIGLCLILLTAGVTMWFATASVILLSLLDAAFQTYNVNVMQSASYRVSDCLTQRVGIEQRNAVIAMRSMVLNLGRVVGMAIFLVVPPDFGSPSLVLLLLSVLSMPFGIFIIRIEKRLERGEVL